MHAEQHVPARRAARAGTQSSTCRRAEQHVPARTIAYECMYSALTISCEEGFAVELLGD